MDVSSTHTNGLTIIFLKGRLYFSHKKALQDSVDLAFNDELVHLNLNLQDVPLVDSGIIGTLMMVKKRCQEKGIGFSLSCLKENVANEFDSINFGALIPIYATDQEVLAASSKSQ